MHDSLMYHFTFYWENTDIGAQYFYVQISIQEERINDLDSHLSVEEFNFPLPADSVEDIKKLAQDTKLHYCGEASYQQVQGRVSQHIKGPIAELFKGIRANPPKKAKKSNSLEGIVIPDFLPEDIN